MSKYGHKPHNWFEAIVNKLGGEDRANQFLRGEFTVSEPARSWREQDGIIYFTVTSDGTTGSEWIMRLENAGYRLSKYTKDLLISPDFAPTAGVTYEVAILKGMLFNDSDRITKKIRAEADRRGLRAPHPEVSCLSRVMLTDDDLKAMRLWWLVTMHELIEDSDGDPLLLGAGRDGEGRRLGAYYDGPGSRWGRGDGFAFAVSQVSA